MKFFRSDLFRNFGIGFAVTGIALFMTRFDGAEGIVAGLM
jgi:hypothetical protein